MKSCVRVPGATKNKNNKSHTQNRRRTNKSVRPPTPGSDDDRLFAHPQKNHSKYKISLIYQ